MDNEVKFPLFDNIRSKFDLLSPKQKVVGSYILSNYKTLAYINLAELARLTETGQGTVVRFAQTLGFRGFSSLKTALRDTIEKSSPRTLEIFSLKNRKGHPGTPFDTVFEMEHSVMNETYELIRNKDFSKAVKTLSEASSVLIVATGSNSFLAEYAGYFMGTMKKNVLIVKNTDMSDINTLLDAPNGAAALVMSFPRYPLKTQTILEILSRKGCPIVGVSDSISSPITGYADPLFIVPQKFVSFMDPYAAVMSILHSILYGIYISDKSSCKKRMEARNELFAEQKLFVSGNVNLPEFMN